MKDREVRKRFMEMRLDGHSLRSIRAELRLGEKTLTRWNRRLKALCIYYIDSIHYASSRHLTDPGVAGSNEPVLSTAPWLTGRTMRQDFTVFTQLMKDLDAMETSIHQGHLPQSLNPQP